MAKYICKNCGHIQRSNGQTGGCISAFWGLGLIFECKASNSIVPLDSPAGETIYKDFYKEDTIDELERKEELVIENNIKSSKDIWKDYFIPILTGIIILFVIISLTNSRGL